MLTPGVKYVRSPVRISATFQDENGVDLDPATVTFKSVSPAGTVSSWVYGVGTTVVRSNTGDYYVDVTPDTSGLWQYRWEATGANTTIAHEGTYRVAHSAFYEGAMDAYRT